LHKFIHFLLGNKKVFYMALVYLVNKPHVSRRIVKWLLFLKYEFTGSLQTSRTHVVVNVLSKLLDNLEPLGLPNPTMDASLFSI